MLSKTVIGYFGNDYGLVQKISSPFGTSDACCGNFCRADFFFGIFVNCVGMPLSGQLGTSRQGGYGGFVKPHVFNLSNCNSPISWIEVNSSLLTVVRCSEDMWMEEQQVTRNREKSKDSS